MYSLIPMKKTVAIAAVTCAGAAFAGVEDICLPGEATLIKAEDFPIGLDLGDLDQDGDLDLIVANNGIDEMFIYFNDGAGNFTLVDTAASPAGDGPNHIVIADFDGDPDGHPDFAVSNNLDFGIDVFFGNGIGNFGFDEDYGLLSTPFSLASGDLDNDGDIDMVAPQKFTNNVAILRNNGDGSFGIPGFFPTGQAPYGVEIADLNMDGNADVITANEDGNNVSVLLGNGDLTFQLTTTYAAVGRPLDIAVGDVDGDGDPDIAVCNWGANLIPPGEEISLYLNNGDGTFASQIVLDTGRRPSAIEIVDLTGDGIVDLVTTNELDDNISILAGNGDGTFQDDITIDTSPSPVDMRIGDVNGDMMPDIVTAHSFLDSVAVHVLNCDEVPPADPGLFQQVWATVSDQTFRRDFAYFIGTDDAGNVYVAGDTGLSETDESYLVIKYNSAGEEQWQYIYNGPADAYDHPFDMAVDGAGNVYITGDSQNDTVGIEWATVKIDTDGNELWVDRYDADLEFGQSRGRSLAVDLKGNVHVTGWSDEIEPAALLGTIKYDSEGNRLWVRTWPDSGQSAIGEDIAVDADGNVYALGQVSMSTVTTDLALVKYDSAGALQWARQVNAATDPFFDDTVGLRVVVSDEQNIYALGRTRTANLSNDFVTVKYDADGNMQWQQVKQTAGSQSATAAVFGEDERIYVAGDSNQGYQIVAYDSAGNELWSVIDPVLSISSSNDRDVLQLGPDGNLHLLVRNTTEPDFTIVTYSVDGEFLDTTQLDFDDSPDVPGAMTFGPDGDLYLAGYTDITPQMSEDFLAMRASLVDLQPADLNNDGSVNGQDLLILLNAWG